MIDWVLQKNKGFDRQRIATKGEMNGVRYVEIAQHAHCRSDDGIFVACRSMGGYRGSDSRV